jgi:FAD:protein FMN transferase
MPARKILYISAILIICFSLLFLLCVRTETRTQLKIGTFVNIRLTGFRWSDFDPVFESAFGAMDMVSEQANLYDSKSRLNLLNKSAHRLPFKASEELFYMIFVSKEIYNESNGALDITVAPLAMLWKTHIENKSVPSKRDIRQALGMTGPDKLVLDEDHRTVYFKKKGMSIDLGAVAKGYAVDKALYEIKKSGFKSAMINAGGDIFCLGKRNFIFPWRVGIRDPYNKDSISKVLNISDKAIATSGGYEQFFQYKGQYYSHLIDPKTGYPADSAFSSVTVVADSCFLADAVATAVYVGGEPVRDKLQAIYPDIEIIALE